MFEAFNDTGGIQIDSNYFNMAISQAGWVTGDGVLSAIGGDASRGWLEITVAGSDPMVAWSSDALVGLAGRVNNGNGTFTFRLITSYPGQGLQYWMFDRPRGGNSFGFQIFDGGGNLTFDAARQYMRVVDFSYYNNGALSASVEEQVTYRDGNRRYAVMPVAPSMVIWQLGKRQNPSNPNSQWLQENFSRIGSARAGWGYSSAGSMLTRWSTYNTGFTAPPSRVIGNQVTRFLVMDVSNY
ncbi:hypothetical protein D9M72_92270 [compost metagenome]